MRTFILALLFASGAYANEAQFKYVDLNQDSNIVAEEACGGAYEIIEKGVIEGDKKLVRFECKDQ